MAERRGREREFKRGHIYPGVLLSLESGEGGGKGKQKEMMIEALRREGYKVVEGREPGATAFGEHLRKILQDPNIEKINERAEMFTYLAARAEYVDKLVIPVLQEGGIFVSDRFRDSTTAYQGYGNGTDLGVIDVCNNYAIFNTNPDLTFVLDVDAVKGLERVTGGEFNGHKLDKIESREIGYHKKVNAGYRRISEDEPERVKLIPYIDGNPEAMHEEIMSYIFNFFDTFGLRDRLTREMNPQP